MVAEAISSASTPSSPARTWAVSAHPGRLVALAAIGRRGQPGGVGFHQHPVQRHAGGHIAQRLGLGIGEISGKGDQKAQVQRAPRLLPSGAEAVHDAAQPGRLPVRFKDFEKIVPGVRCVVFRPAMDQDRPLPRRGNFKLADEPLALHIVRRAFVVVVQADLAAGNHLRLGQQAVELGEDGVVRLRACCADRHRRWRRAGEDSAAR